MQRVSIELQGTRGQPSSCRCRTSTQSASSRSLGRLETTPSDFWNASWEGVDMELAFVDLDLFAPDSSLEADATSER